jgi:SAM-dependent methyltransferase
MRTYDELVAEAEAADVGGWGFGWLDGRATEERPPWGYARLLAERLGQVRSALDIDTGGGEVVAEAAALPPGMAVTEGWPPNAERARSLLGPRGVRVVESDGGPLPFADQSFELVTSRHPVRPDWDEIHRVLAPSDTADSTIGSSRADSGALRTTRAMGGTRTTVKPRVRSRHARGSRAPASRERPREPSRFAPLTKLQA